MSDSCTLLKLVSEAFREFYQNLTEGNPVARLLSTAIEATNADRGTVFLDPGFNIDENFKSLRSFVATGIKDSSIVVGVDKGVAGHVFQTREGYFTNNVSQDPYFYSHIDHQTGYTTRSMAAVPLRWKNGVIMGVLQVLNKKTGEFSTSDLQTMEVIAVLASMAIDHMVTLETLEDTENVVAHKRTLWSRAMEGITLKSENPELQSIYDNVARFAQSDSSCLIEGESGTGKEVITRMIHTHSARKSGPLIAINCAAIPGSLFEAELFGVAKGTATGVGARKGQIELAHRGTLFMDEIGELPLEMQAKLLRVLQERRVIRLGAEDQGRMVDFRLVCATNRDLSALVKEGKFREDLYYRINVVNLKLPPLRERRGDIPAIAQSMIENLHLKRGWPRKSISSQAQKKLLSYEWPGNVRELQNRIESALIMSRDRAVIGPEDLLLGDIPSNVVSLADYRAAKDVPGPWAQFDGKSMKDAKAIFENELVERTIKQAGGNKAEAARRLGMSREGLRKLIGRRSA